MKIRPIPHNEQDRLRALRNYEILDSLKEYDFDRITELASLICDVPISLVTLIDEHRQWFKSSVGISASETPRDLAFCNYTIMDDAFFEVSDATRDDRFKDNMLVTGDYHVRFYAGYPLVDPEGYALGSLCVVDRIPKKLSPKQKRSLELLAEEVISLIVDRRLREELRSFEKLFKLSNDLVFIGGLDGYFKKINPAFTKTFGWSKEHLLNTSSFEFYHPDDIESTAQELVKIAGGGHETSNFLQRFKCSDGSYKIIEWTSTPEKETGNIFGIGRDVSDLKLKEQLLTASEERFRVFFEHSLGLMYTHDMNGNFLSVNDAGAFILGYTREEILTMTLYHIVPADRRKNIDAYLNNIKNEGILKGQTSTVQKDGSVRMWLYNSVLENSPDLGLYVIVNGTDITDRHNLEKELKRTTHMLEETNQVARVGGWELDVRSRKLFWTSVTKEIHGVPPDFEPNLDTAMLFYKEGESREKLISGIKQAIAHGGKWDLEVQITNAAGEDIWVSAIGNAEFEHGVCKRLFGTFQDINNYKLAQMALRRSLETQERLNDVMVEQIELIEKQDRTIEKIQEFKFLADSIPQIVWTSKPDGRPDHYNKYWFDYTGLTLEETMSQGWATVLHPDDVQVDLKEWERSVNSRDSYQAELRFKRAADGVYKWHLVRAIPMKSESGQIVKWFGSGSDIDEYKRALDLENRISQFEDFNRIVAHNLRGPAGSIDLMLNMIAESGDELEKAELMPLLKQSSTTLIDTLNELMKVLEVRTNYNIAFDDCNLHKMVEAVERMLKGQIIAKNAVITTDFKIDEMKFPKMYLESIFYNMVSNSLKYSKPGVRPQVTITADKKDGNVILTFSDNGLGIDLQLHRKKLFGLNATFHKGFDSKGVGLFMTKTQIETFGGRISVESEPNVGTTFTIVF